MKNIKLLNLFAFLLLISVACSDEETSHQCDETAMVNEEKFSEAVGHLPITAARIVGDCLEIDYAASGCDGDTWVVALIGSESVLESLPVQRPVVFTLENLEECLAIINMTSSFDITEFQVDGESEVILRIGEDITVSYKY